MSTPLAIIGQNVEIRIVTDGKLEQNITDIISASVTVNTDVLDGDYLGQEESKLREVFKNFEGEITLETFKADFFDFLDKIIQKAKGKNSIVFTIAMIANYPNGEVVKLMFPDVKFISPSINIGGKNEKVRKTLKWRCSSYKRI